MWTANGAAGRIQLSCDLLFTGEHLFNPKVLSQIFLNGEHLFNPKVLSQKLLTGEHLFKSTTFESKTFDW